MQAILVLIGTMALGLERGEATFRPTLAESQVPQTFRLTAATFPFELDTVREEPTFRVSALRFPSPVESPDPVNNTVRAEYFRPKVKGRGPAVVVLHILGADFALSRYLATRLAQRGVAALFVQLPYYGDRRPPGADRRFLSPDINRSIGAMRQGICDVRRAAAWLANRDEVDPSRIGVAGISLGGIIGSVATAVDPAISAVTPILAGGDLANVLWEMPEGARYRQQWTDLGRTKADLVALTAPFDPLTNAARLRGKRVLMIAGTVDEVIPPASSRALWEAAGRPPIRWCDCGHYSSAGYLLPMLREVVDFFAEGPEKSR